MGELDYLRFDKILKAVDTYGFLTNSGDIDFLRSYYSSLFQLYVNWRTILYKDEQQLLDKKFKELDRLITDYFSSKKKNNIFLGRIIERLNEINIRLIDLKQRIGLGVPLKQVISGKRKTSQYLLGS